jgi:hypothetical protein
MYNLVKKTTCRKSMLAMYENCWYISVVENEGHHAMSYYRQSPSYSTRRSYVVNENSGLHGTAVRSVIHGWPCTRLWMHSLATFTSVGSVCYRKSSIYGLNWLDTGPIGAWRVCPLGHGQQIMWERGKLFTGAIPILFVVLGLRPSAPTVSLSSWPSAPTKHSCSWVLNCWCPPLRCPQPPMVCGRRPRHWVVSRKHDVWWGVPSPAEHDACWALGSQWGRAAARGTDSQSCNFGAGPLAASVPTVGWTRSCDIPPDYHWSNSSTALLETLYK